MRDLRTRIEEYNRAWNDHDLDAIMAMHSPDMVLENHTVGEIAEGEAVREQIAAIFEALPDLHLTTRRIYVRRDLVVQEWTATATHERPVKLAGVVAEPSGRKLTWKGMDVIPFEDDLVARRDIYSDSAAILREAGLLAA